MQTQCRHVANFDPEGLIFAVGINSEYVKLYDLRSFDKGPFNAFTLSHNKDVNWTGLKFSPDGKQICITTDANTLVTLDSFMGHQLHTFTTSPVGGNSTKTHQISCEATYSPDSQYLFTGTNDGSIYVWDAEKGTKVTILKGERSSPIQCVQFNPKFMMLAAACTKMSFWIPDEE
uniref:WD repeat-containing protein 82 n=1 Tax=Aceria tosichella TaxID=561515 RepID=A0A6G1SD90_9ACAR